jgi:hypothetical protein
LYWRYIVALTLDWRARIDRWWTGLRDNFYRPLGVLNVAGFATREQLTARQALSRAFKPAEDGSPDVIVRLYEAMRSATQCIMDTSPPLRSAVETDMLDQERLGKLVVSGGKIELVFRPFEIKTARFSQGRI